MYRRMRGSLVVGLVSGLVVMVGCDREQTRPSNGEEATAVPGDDDFEEVEPDEEASAEDEVDGTEESDDPGAASPV